VALEKSRGNFTAAADALRKYLDTWSNDREAWEELGELYLQVWCGVVWCGVVWCGVLWLNVVVGAAPNGGYTPPFLDAVASLFVTPHKR
jgi:hypothetical protein